MSEYLKHQDNRRGYGLARDVKAGQANEAPGSIARRNKRLYGQPQGPDARQFKRFRV